MEEDDEVVVYSPSTGGCAVLNVTAAAALDLCDGARTIEDIAAEIVHVLPADPVQVVADVAATVSRLADLGVVQWSR